MSGIKIARYKDDVHEFRCGFSRCPALEGAYGQASFARCKLLPGSEIKPERHALEEHNQLFLFFGGRGYITTPRKAWNIVEPSVFVPEFDREEFAFRSSADSKEPLEFLHIVTETSDYDKTCLKESRMALPRFRGLSGGWAYCEDFKEEGTASLMLLEHRNLGRLSMGAVLGRGATTIGQHVHNELAQWYFPLKGSSLTYEADGERVELTGGDLSYTQAGLYHGSSAKEGQTYDYIWFELCENGYPGEIK
jgi:hypothetical protein